MLEISVSHKKCTFLLDTQADISLIKLGTIKPRERLDTSELIDITGITDFPISTLGFVEATLKNDDFMVNFPFHVVPDHFHIPSDGIIGKDFMRTFKCKIDYDTMLFTFRLDNQTISIPMLEGPTDGTIVLPARSEVTRQFNLRTKIMNPRLVSAQELKKGVFVARTVINSSNPLLRLINTTGKVMVIRNDIIDTDDLSDYDVFNLNDVKRDEERTGTLINILRKQAPDYCHDKLLPLCEEFADIFAL